MQQLPLSAQTDSRKLVEDLYDFLGTLIRGWRLVAVCVAITITLAVIYLASAKPVYSASARLLVLQHGGQPLNVSGGAGNNQDSLFQPVDGYSNSLTTHIMIIKSPLIVGRSLASAGLKNLSAGSVIAGLTVKLPDPLARVLELSYKAGSRDQAVKVVDSVVKSYDRFLQENYQKNSNEVLDLITKARDELSADLKKLEKEYLEYRQKSTGHPAAADGKTFIARRLDQWDQAISQAMLKSLNLKSQLELGRTLADDGASVDAIGSALGHLGGTPLAPAAAQAAPVAGLSYDRVEAELGEIIFQRQTAESLLVHLRDEYARAVSETKVSEDELSREFYALPEIAERGKAYRQALDAYSEARRLSRQASDPAVVRAKKRMNSLEAELAQHWKKMKPAIKARLAGGDVEQIHEAANELMVLKAKEASFRERLEEFKSQRVAELEAKHGRLAKQYGMNHAKVAEVREQLARLTGNSDESSSDPRQAQSRALLKSIEQGLKSVEAMKAEVEQRFQQDLAESNKSEIGLLGESNLKNNLERQRVLFYSVVDQLKQAQLVSDFGSVTAQVLDPPAALESRPPIPLVLLAALVVGIALGVGAVYIADQLDARVRSLPEIRRLLDYRMLGVVPLLTRGQQGEMKIGMVSHVKPRSRLAETYKSIRTGIELLRRNWQGNVFMVTSAQPADGKSTTASNLAICMAQSGKKVLLVDADLRRPSQHLIHGLARSPGMTHVLNDLMPFHMAVQPTDVPNLDLLSAGAEVANPAELLAMERMISLVAELRQAYDMVFIDTSPLLVVTDPSIIAVAIDGMVLVVRASVTRRHDAERCHDLLKALQTPVLGLVINGINPGQRGYGYGYGYGYLYGYGAYGRSKTTGNGDEPAAIALPVDRAAAKAELPGIGLNGTNGHANGDS